MSESQGPAPVPTQRPFSTAMGQSGRPQPANLADILERVLDKGIIIAGDIQVNLLDIELLTIKIRLLIVSVDKAQEMGIDWWRNDPMFSSSARELQAENQELRQRLDELESGSGANGSGQETSSDQKEQSRA